LVNEAVPSALLRARFCQVYDRMACSGMEPKGILPLVPKPDRSGSGSSPEGTESGTEDRQKNWTAHFPILNTNIFFI